MLTCFFFKFFLPVIFGFYRYWTLLVFVCFCACHPLLALRCWRPIIYQFAKVFCTYRLTSKATALAGAASYISTMFNVSLNSIIPVSAVQLQNVSTCYHMLSIMYHMRIASAPHKPSGANPLQNRPPRPGLFEDPRTWRNRAIASRCPLAPTCFHDAGPRCCCQICHVPKGPGAKPYVSTNPKNTTTTSK